MKLEKLSHNYYHSFEELEKTASEYIDFFKGMRPHLKMGNLTPDEIEGAIRFSLSDLNTEEEVLEAAKIVKECVEDLRMIIRRR